MHSKNSITISINPPKIVERAFGLEWLAVFDVVVHQSSHLP